MTFYDSVQGQHYEGGRSWVYTDFANLVGQNLQFLLQRSLVIILLQFHFQFVLDGVGADGQY